ncbi:MAG: hypothetical protein LUQ65_03555 [Candidatus Helarchaeota archaeon]|nr:hypothetical protein [Candidatus Helarchaeota archaeon]
METTTRIGNAQDLFDLQVNQLVAKRAFPEVVAFLYKTRGPEQAREDLRKIASLIMQHFLLVWTPRSNKPFEIVKEMMQFFGKHKIKWKVLEQTNGQPLTVAIRDNHCPICPDKKVEEVVVKKVHYCVAVSGSIEVVFNYLVQKKLVSFTKAKCETVKSTGSGDAYCEHILTLEYGEVV